MTGALIILGVLVIVGVFLYVGEIRHRRKAGAASEPTKPAEAAEPTEANEAAGTIGTTGAAGTTGTNEPTDKGEGECCGLHLVCEKDSLSPMSGEIEYYDDEELDRFLGRDGNDYSPEETEEFRDVLMTLRPQDVSGWARSITARRLILPPDIRDELLLLVNEQRHSP